MRRVSLLLLIVLPLFAIQNFKMCFSVPEELTYTVKTEGEESGKSLYIVNEESIEGVDAYKIESYSELMRAGSPVHDSVTLYVEKNTWKPIYLRRVMKTPKFEMELVANYGKDKVNVSLTTNQGSKNFSIDLKEGAIDNEEVIYYLRCLDFENLKSGKLFDVTTMGGRIVEIKWEYKGEEKIKIGDKEFDSYKIELKLPGRKIEVNYEKGGKRRMLRYLDKSTLTELILKP